MLNALELAGTTVGGRTATIVFGDKDVDNGKEVVSQLAGMSDIIVFFVPFIFLCSARSRFSRCCQIFSAFARSNACVTTACASSATRCCADEACSVCRTVNQEPCAHGLKDAFQVVKGEATQAVAVGHHNAADLAVQDAVQKGLKPLAAEVDATADVADDVVGGIGGLEVLDLPREVGALVATGDACVEDVASLCATSA
jgi:hypothetical protein